MISVEISDADFDDMHHALGRPEDPRDEPYRNRYCCEADGPQAARFAEVGLWAKVCTINAGRDAIFSVTDEGRRQVMAWHARRQRERGLRAWWVEGGGLSGRRIIAKSASGARYSAYLDLSDVYTFDDGFRGFLRLGVKVRPDEPHTPSTSEPTP